MHLKGRTTANILYNGLWSCVWVALSTACATLAGFSSKRSEIKKLGGPGEVVKTSMNAGFCEHQLKKKNETVWYFLSCPVLTYLVLCFVTSHPIPSHPNLFPTLSLILSSFLSKHCLLQLTKLTLCPTNGPNSQCENTILDQSPNVMEEKNEA